MHSTLISTEELARRLGDPALVVVDVRHDLMQPDAWGESRYAESHIPGARFVHLDRELSAAKNGRNGRHPLPSVEEATALFSRVGIDAHKQVVAYDQNAGMFAARLWWMLRWLGHDAVAVLDGGFEQWTSEGRPVTSQLPVVEPAVFVARQVKSTMTTADVLDDLNAPTLTLLDARAPERFRGEIEPLDPVAGHIPGAINRFYGSNVDTQGRFKSPQALRNEFAQLLGTAPLERVVHYCGSGVTACHNQLAMEVAGLPGTQLFPGSWSEWCADESRPVAVGYA
ncbi:MAG TPA: sulfurtransferase [Casimicrobiaceae bacterium]|nr:sulfurtransferase [Casimicrobiaceae bacterium]